MRTSKLHALISLGLRNDGNLPMFIYYSLVIPRIVLVIPVATFVDHTLMAGSALVRVSMLGAVRINIDVSVFIDASIKKTSIPTLGIWNVSTFG